MLNTPWSGVRKILKIFENCIAVIYLKSCNLNFIVYTVKIVKT